MKTSVANREQQLRKQWFLVDLDGKVLGRVAAQVAAVLRGKHKATFTPHLDMGDHVVVINASKVKVTGNKREGKIYYSHSGYKGALKETPFNRLMERKPAQAFYFAVAGMLPSNKLKKEVLKKLHIFEGADHSHEAQKPLTLEF